MPRITTTTPTTPRPVTTDVGRSKYVTRDQKQALARCDKVVAKLRASITEAAKKDPLLKGITPASITVDTLGDFPAVAVRKNGKVLFDRQQEIDHLRKLLPASWRSAPIGEISPY